MNQNKMTIPNLLIESKKKKRNKRIRKIVTFSIIYMILIYLFYGFFNICQYYYYHHEFYFQSPIYIQTPLRIVPKYYMDKDPTRYNGEQEYPTSPLQNDLEPTITPKPRNIPAKKISSIVEPVIGRENNIDFKIFWSIIWKHESTNGTAPNGLHIYCRKLGKWNEIGYNPQAKFCFESEDQAKEKIKEWILKCDNGINNCLCRYNTGKNVNTCAYANGDLNKSN
jgi:hypothetical protein